MKIPPAPGWESVFLFGAVWNGVINRSVWAALVCAVVAVVIYVLKQVPRVQ
jgi:hypothetical protein